MLLALASVICSLTYAQEEKEVYQIKIVKDVDGKKEVIDKKFETKEEMMTWMKANGHEVKLPEGSHPGGHKMIMKKIDGGEDGEIELMIDAEGDFEFEGDEEIKVLKLRMGEEGMHHGEMDEAELKKMMDELKSALKNKLSHSELSDEEIEKIMEQMELKLNESGSRHHKMIRHIEHHGEGQEGLHEERIIIVSCFVELEDMEQKDWEVLDDQGLNSFVEKLNVEDLSVYPNPSDGQMSLSFELLNKKRTTFRLIDAAGNILEERDLGKIEGRQQFELNLQDKAEGVYYVQIIQGDEALTKKVIKN